MSTLQYEDGRPVKTVKNLGWLLANWKLVDSIEVIGGRAGWDALLIVHCSDRRTVPSTSLMFVTDFASKSILWDWLQRPVFFSVPLSWFGVDKMVTKGAKYPS